MALDPSITTTVANNMLDAGIGNDADSGLLRIYAGSVPADANAALGGATLLAELTMNAAAFPAASSATLTAAAITADSSANATGTATFFRLYKADGTTVLLQGTAGTSTTDMILNTTSIVSGANVSVSSFTITMPVT